MSEPKVDQLLERVANLEKVVKHLSVRSTISLNLLSALSAALCYQDKSEIFRDVLTQQIANFNYQPSASNIDPDIIVAEKKAVLDAINSVILPKAE